MTENTTTSPGNTKAALPPPDCSACLGEWRPEGEQAVIDATFDANDRVRERRFAQGLPCLLTGLTKEQWEAQKIEPRFHIDSEIGLTMGDTTVKQNQDGTWKATAPIGTIFGSEVDGECCGEGATKEAALASLALDRKRVADALWF